jgi:uncharacterized protein (TIGR01244 family)
MLLKDVSVFCLLLLPALLMGQDDVPFPEKLDATGFREVLARSGNLYISGQPDEASFAKLLKEGVTTVVNLRTQEEMDDRQRVPFDEKKVVEDLGMKYVHIPLGGSDHPYVPEALKTFADTLAHAEGKVLLHCTVAWRASQMFAAYLIADKNFPPEKAIEYAKAVNFGEMPVEGLLGKKLVIGFK